MVIVASMLHIMDQVGSLDSSRDLQPNHAKSFINRFHLVLQISKIPLHFFTFTAFCVYVWEPETKRCSEREGEREKNRDGDERRQRAVPNIPRRPSERRSVRVLTLP